jgi:predicted Rossmann fold nucleotide-binding protein DprA/Smf involved in DNA uptake
MSPKQLKSLTAMLASAADSAERVAALTKNNARLVKALTRIGTIVTAAIGKTAAPRATTAGRASTRGGRRPKLADGALGQRLREAATEPVTLKELVAAGNARPQDVKKAVLQLERDGWLTRSGAGRSTKYQAAA